METEGFDEVKDRECLEKREESAAKRSLRTSLDAFDEWSCWSFVQALYSAKDQFKQLAKGSSKSLSSLVADLPSILYGYVLTRNK